MRISGKGDLNTGTVVSQVALWPRRAKVLLDTQPSMIVSTHGSWYHAALASGIIIPLYVYPGTSCSGWPSLSAVIAEYASLPFYIIVNPASGPGGAGTQPDSTYQECIPTLKASNVKIIGYVLTGYGGRDQADVTTDIDTYAGWASSYQPDGIFFDEVSGATADFSTYSTYTSYAKQLFDSGGGFTTLNPGISPSDLDYFTIADLIVTAEQYYSDFDASDLSFNSSAPASKQAVILHDAPSTPPTALIDQLITTDQLKAIYITDDTQANNGNPYDSLPSDLSSFVNAVESAASA
ncbi:Spherulin-4 [Grifola frondosa]|uniref:Spherulin-4 n=1 Tax=Grifola frondosa TaxID=5627 RepID=A0A1C7MJ66_GRIFR|nr:Spherulin-4 [Grifola frondosa]